jgi:3',5'-nucleoside bisphosphate phosphatase
MKAAVDLHIHSALSPCADNDMTPNNIVNMASLKELDIIAVTDHNSVGNFEAVSKCAKRNKILAIPGMEVETREEVHLICLFQDLNSALKMQKEIDKSLPQIENREEIFGRQVVLDEEDNIVEYKKQLLITASSLSVEEVFHLVDNLLGVVIPAHVDRSSYSILTNLGLIPDNLKIKYLELSRNCDARKFKNENPELKKFEFIISSDAHSLCDILERESFLELEEISEKCLIKALSI